jgi:hypothetical protein
VIVLAVVVAYNLEPAVRRKGALRIVLVRNLEEVAVPIVVDKEAAEAVHRVVAHREVEVAVPIAVDKEAAVAVQAVHMAVEVVHREVEVAVPNLAAAVRLDHKTWIIPPVGNSLLRFAPFEADVQYHTTGV